MKVTVIIEKASDGWFSCYMEEDVRGMGLTGSGESAAEAKADMLEAYEEIKAMTKDEGMEAPDLEFTYKYDMVSFFNYFDVINISKLAEKAGMNSSLLRRYSKGITRASQKQYERIEQAVKEIGSELLSASF